MTKITAAILEDLNASSEQLVLHDVIEKALTTDAQATTVTEAVLEYLRNLESKPIHYSLFQFEPLDGPDYFYENNELTVWGERNEATEHARNMGFYSRSENESYSEYLIQFDEDSDVDENSIMYFLEYEVNTSDCAKLLETLRNTPGILVRGG